MNSYIYLLRQQPNKQFNVGFSFHFNVVFFNVELNNVRQGRNNVVMFNVYFHNVGKRRNNVANMTICKKNISLDSKTK